MLRLSVRNQLTPQNIPRVAQVDVVITGFHCILCLFSDRGGFLSV